MNDVIKKTSVPLHILIAGFLADKGESTRKAYKLSVGYLFEFMGAKHEGESFDEFMLKLRFTPELGSMLSTFSPVFGVAFREWLVEKPLKSERDKHPTLMGTRGKGLSTKTLHRHFAACRGLFEWLRLHGFPLEHPDPLHGKLVKLPKKSVMKHTRALSEGEVVKLLGRCNLRTLKGMQDACMVSLFFGGGLRMSEAINVKLSDVKLTSSGTPYLYLKHTKKGVEDRQALPSWACGYIVKWKKERERQGAHPDFYLLSPMRCANHGGAKPLDQSAVNRRLKALAKAAGVKGDISSHVGRATSITQLLNQGYNHRDITQFSRHSSITMVEHYDKAARGLDDNVGLKLVYRGPKG